MYLYDISTSRYSKMNYVKDDVLCQNWGKGFEQKNRIYNGTRGGYLDCIDTRSMKKEINYKIGKKKKI